MIPGDVPRMSPEDHKAQPTPPQPPNQPQPSPHTPKLTPEENGGHTGAVVALALGQSAIEGALTEYVISGSKDGTMGVFQASDGAPTYKHQCGEGVSSLAAFDPTPGTSALLLVGYEVCVVCVLLCWCVCVYVFLCFFVRCRCV